ncbi:MAG: hypothetical protein KA965_07380 [Butyrivibrio sp.]|nr:hypothetical protein [Butyrivibrio sp.]
MSAKEKKPVKKNVKKSVKNGVDVNSRLIAPIIMLSATAVVAIYTYLQRYPIARWLVIVLGTMVLFLIIGLILEKMIEYFEKTNYEKELQKKAQEKQDALNTMQDAQDQNQTGTEPGNNHSAAHG